jgi:hypothetical protein
MRTICLTIDAQGLELLSTVLRSRGNEFDADVMMRFHAVMVATFTFSIFVAGGPLPL